jgi:uncharacterized protein YggE
MMATMNFSIPESVKTRFNQTFLNSNKSAIVAELLEEAINRAEQKARSDLAIQQILSIRQSNTPQPLQAVLRARDQTRNASISTNGPRNKSGNRSK